jgi:hypothetical protein
VEFLAGRAPSQRNEIYYFAEATLGAVRIGDYKYRFIDQPQGWLGGTVRVDWPMLTNIRLDPFERTGIGGSLEYASWMTYEFWRFVFVQQEVARFAQTFIDFPPPAEARQLQPRGGQGAGDEGHARPSRRLGPQTRNSY